MYPAYNLEPNLGMLVVMPWAVIICVVAWQKRQLLFRTLNLRNQVLIITCTSALGAWVIQLLTVSGTTWRYVADFAPLFLLALLAQLLSLNSSRISLNLNFRFISAFALGVLLYQNQLGGRYSLGLILIFVLCGSRQIAIQIHATLLLVLATAWTVGIIGLTSLTVGGFDYYNFLPYGFWWWQV
jgi:hypothetical protein